MSFRGSMKKRSPPGAMEDRDQNTGVVQTQSERPRAVVNGHLFFNLKYYEAFAWFFYSN